MSTEIPILYNDLRREFERALQSAGENEFIERPRALSGLARRRNEFVQNARLQNQKALERLQLDSQALCESYSLAPLEAKDLVLYAWDLERRLFDEGAVFGNRPFNFVLERMALSSPLEQQVRESSLNAMRALKILSRRDLKSELPFLPLNPVEKIFEGLKLTPNAARLDFLLTDAGPKLVEVNCQWVDAIVALQAFQQVFLGRKRKPSPIDTLAEKFFFGKRVAILDVNQISSGSRNSGATQELQTLSRKLMYTRRPPLECEVLDPSKISMDYFRKFNMYYVNCDPRYFLSWTPPWIEYINERVAKGGASIFPSWRPLLDKKFVLSILSSPDSSLADEFSREDVDVEMLKSIVTPTKPLTERLPYKYPIVIKGDGYSLNSVVTSLQDEFPKLLEYALQDANSYVVQPFLEGMRVNSWVFDTGKRKVRLLQSAYTKLNVWVLGDEVVGMLLTISDSPLISDKGFNTVPLVRKEK